ncbi:MAG: (Fe-S)-binding protein [Acidimicrobiales bacterium]
MRASVFTTCLVDALFPNVGDALVTLFARLNVRLDIPDQTCCGQMHINTGYRSMALALVRNHVRAFASSEYVVGLSASCVGSVRHQYESIAAESGDDRLVEGVRCLREKTYEVSEFLIDVLGVDDVGAYFPHRVTYHPTGHSLRVLHLGDRPTTLLQHVEGIELVELHGADECCGFGGTFSVKNADVSGAMLADKLLHVRSTGAEVLAACDSSCLMHMGGGLSLAGDDVRPLHLVEILASSR